MIHTSLGRPAVPVPQREDQQLQSPKACIIPQVRRVEFTHVAHFLDDLLSLRNYYGAQNDYTHMFLSWELISQLHRTSVTHGYLAGILLCNSGAYEGIFCECANYTHHLSVN